ncbi:hypothetical protein C8R46DRAFT_1347496 [Mycena filopes]|nr:hypothetical protein C8R46DRAFT_1347496 [Mycena filopes]
MSNAPTKTGKTTLRTPGNREWTLTRNLPMPPEVATLLATVLPNASPQELHEYWNTAFSTADGLEVAMASFRQFRDAFNTGVVIGRTTLPTNPNFLIKSADIGPFTIKYHATFPADIQEEHAFTWNFYIGWQGQDPMTDWEEQGITVDIPLLNHGSEWMECRVLQVLPYTRVRLTYKGVRHHLCFPPDPREVKIVYLQ